MLINRLPTTQHHRETVDGISALPMAQTGDR